MERSSDAMKAREALNGKAFDGRKIEVTLFVQTFSHIFPNNRDRLMAPPFTV